MILMSGEEEVWVEMITFLPVEDWWFEESWLLIQLLVDLYAYEHGNTSSEGTIIIGVCSTILMDPRILLGYRATFMKKMTRMRNQAFSYK